MTLACFRDADEGGEETPENPVEALQRAMREAWAQRPPAKTTTIERRVMTIPADDDGPETTGEIAVLVEDGRDAAFMSVDVAEQLMTWKERNG